ncbi:MAG: bifunctional pyr operon transcriptional regulator/uracil phosphoribosyltransferase PyrR [Oleiphilaceae bacterium]|nr:bifunctional pyr operon transcriptional regulator/uracil phosphoribosyltransferase PyrR [Oleiphilaceae bacterium]
MHDSKTVETLLHSMTQELEQDLHKKNINEFEMVGIRTGGVWVAQAIAQRLSAARQIGELDISFYRDDFTRIGLNPKVRPSSLPFATEGKHIVLVDDVLMSGRTIRAAMNELFDYGRPASITLVVLVDLHRPELPIRPDIVGARIALGPQERIKLLGPEALSLEIRQVLPSGENT